MSDSFFFFLDHLVQNEFLSVNEQVCSFIFSLKKDQSHAEEESPVYKLLCCGKYEVS